MNVEELVRQLEELKQPNARVVVTGLLSDGCEECGADMSIDKRLHVVNVTSECNKVIIEVEE